MARLQQTLAAAILAACLAAGCAPPADTPGRGGGHSPAGPAGPAAGRGAAPPRGGTLVASVRTDPQSFNWYTRSDGTTYLVTAFTQARLVRVNRVTDEVEPWLAESWTREDEGLRYRFTLRPGVAFSDGRPFTADDVVFSFRALYDAKGATSLASALKVDGRPLAAAAIDPRTVDVTFPAPFGPGVRLLDNLPILPRHALGPALEAGTFREAWTLAAPPRDIVGLGPFVLDEYVPGQRMVFARNARYFRTDAAGAPLPYLDRLVLQIVPDQSVQVLQLEAGQSDMLASEVRVEDYAPLKRAADAGRVQLFDLGVGLFASSFWFNLRPGAFAGDPRAAWIQRVELRQAVSHAVDRALFNDTVFLGQGVPVFGPVTPGNRTWHAPGLPPVPHDPARARALLAGIGLADRDGDGSLEDAAGRPARFSLMTQKGQTPLERGAAVVRDELRKIGLQVDVVALEGNALVDRFLSGKPYDAVYFHFETTDTDPALTHDFWLSTGPAHVWNPGQKTPATAWEREIDALMLRQAAALDLRERQALFGEVQAIFARELPIIHFVAPKVFAAASARAANLTPAVLRPQLLWAPDTIAVIPGRP